MDCHGTKHPNTHDRPSECFGCRREKIERFQVELNKALLDMLPFPMRLALKSKIEKVVSLLAEVVL